MMYPVPLDTSPHSSLARGGYQVPPRQMQPQQMSFAPVAPHGSSPTYQSHRLSPTAAAVYGQSPPPMMAPLHNRPHVASGKQCEEGECAEEECDPEQCGAENSPPRTDHLTCGFDTRPVLPLTLAASTVGGAVCMFLFQAPLLQRFFEWGIAGKVCWLIFLGLLYGTTIGCLAYCCFADPGQIPRDEDAEGYDSNEGDSKPVPLRAHKTWQYSRPVRRYDHYCRWVTNCIGLYNHREFLTMCIGLVSIAILGLVVDAVLFYFCLQEAETGNLVGLGLHFAYSSILLGLAGPILRIHVGLVSRNELANEWKRNDFYVAQRSKRGVNIAANELSDDEFNALFDNLHYDPNRNTFDKGCLSNCMSFWCTPRWRPEERGEF